MKDIITITLLYAFLIFTMYQPAMNSVNAARGTVIANIEHVALEQAKIKGYFTAADLSQIQNSVATAIGYPTSDVTVTGTTTPQDRGQFITLSISVPVYIGLFHNLHGPDQTATITRTESAMSEAIQ